MLLLKFRTGHERRFAEDACAWLDWDAVATHLAPIGGALFQSRLIRRFTPAHRLNRHFARQFCE